VRGFFVISEKRKLKLGLFVLLLFIQIEQVCGVLFEVAIADEFVIF